MTRLRVIIEPGVDPDDTYNETPYEKGYCFVSYLQHLVGDKKKFDDFLKDYVEKYKFKVGSCRTVRLILIIIYTVGNSDNE